MRLVEEEEENSATRVVVVVPARVLLLFPVMMNIGSLSTSVVLLEL